MRGSYSSTVFSAGSSPLVQDVPPWASEARPAPPPIVTIVLSGNRTVLLYARPTDWCEAVLQPPRPLVATDAVVDAARAVFRLTNVG